MEMKSEFLAETDVRVPVLDISTLPTGKQKKHKDIHLLLVFRPAPCSHTQPYSGSMSWRRANGADNYGGLGE